MLISTRMCERDDDDDGRGLAALAWIATTPSTFSFKTSFLLGFQVTWAKYKSLTLWAERITVTNKSTNLWLGHDSISLNGSTCMILIPTQFMTQMILPDTFGNVSSSQRTLDFLSLVETLVWGLEEWKSGIIGLLRPSAHEFLSFFFSLIENCFYPLAMKVQVSMEVAKCTN